MSDAKRRQLGKSAWCIQALGDGAPEVQRLLAQALADETGWASGDVFDADISPVSVRPSSRWRSDLGGPYMMLSAYGEDWVVQFLTGARRPTTDLCVYGPITWLDVEMTTKRAILPPEDDDDDNIDDLLNEQAT
jgi:hypothetical protein